jgi:hypothetical protein
MKAQLEKEIEQLKERLALTSDPELKEIYKQMISDREKLLQNFNDRENVNL